MTQPSQTSGRSPDRRPAVSRKQDVARNRKSRFLRACLMAFLCLTLAGRMRADTITGAVRDPSGAVVAGARVEITGGTLTEPVVVITDMEGKFVAPNLAAGKYLVRVSKEGFEDSVARLDLKGSADLPVNLTIASQQTSVSVTGKVSAFANS